MVFHFIDATAFIEILDNAYPAELAIAKYSLKRGIFEDFHIRINPGELPLGAAYEAKRYAELYHRMPVPPTANGEEDFNVVIDAICNFLGPMKELPIFYSEGSVRYNRLPWRITRKVMEALIARSQKPELEAELKVYPVEELFFIIQRDNSDLKLESIDKSYAKLNLGYYEYSTEGCAFHQEDDSAMNCCLSKVRRVGYSISKLCVKQNRIEGSHFPIGCRDV